jgi:type I restriction enzyme S subunit
MSVPALRFKEFSGEWDLYPLKDRIDFLAGYAFDSKLMRAEKSIFQLIKMSNVYQSELSLDRNPAYWGELDNGTRKFLLKKGDVVLTLTGTVGKKDYGYSVDIPDDNKFLINQRLVRLREVSEKSTNKFIKYVLLTERFYYQFFSDSKGGTGNQSNVSIEDLKKIHLYLPSLPEQTKIANFLTCVDEKISLLTQKATLLSQYKKGVMQQIFSQELRFKDDDGQVFPEWEEASIGSLFIIKAGGDIASSNVSSVKTDIYTYPIFSNSEKNLGLFGYTDEFKINTESITVTGRGTLGIAIPRYAPYYPIVRLLSLIPKPTFNVYFGASAINMLNVFIESTGVPQLTAPQISDYVISFPSLPEQTKIANFLTAIDEKITNNQTQLDAVKQYKQGLLQQMFV